MQKIGLNQSLQQKLSPQQIQFIKLLQVPTVELANRIEEELEINPALEEGAEEVPDEQPEYESAEEKEEEKNDDLDLADYIRDDDYNSFKTHSDNDDDMEIPIPTTSSVHESLLTQLGYLGLDERKLTIGKQLIGSIDGDGYIRREIESIVNDLAFSQNIETHLEEVASVLKQIQTFDPPGIAARNLQECLLIQLDREANENAELVKTAKQILLECFAEFTNKHYPKILKKLQLEEEEVRDAMELIMRLNPKPGGESASSLAQKQYIIPDFMVTHIGSKLDISLNSRNAPELHVSRDYSDMFKAYDKSNKQDRNLKDAVVFVKQKLDAAKWFIEAIKQRQNTLMKTMTAILEFQYDYFLDGDETHLKPMILKDIAQKIGMDISTISRVVSSKTVQTDFGVFPLKYFFSEGIATDSGEEVSSHEVKLAIKELIAAESKAKPLSDDKLEELLNQRGYNIARRTVAKYREQLNIPVARLRKEI